MPRVVIDGETYIPVREARMPAREAVARVLADMFWGGLKTGPDWEADFDDKMSGVCVEVNEGISSTTAHEFLDLVVEKLAKSSVSENSGGEK